MSEEFLTISQLNQFIKDVVNSGFPQPLWVCGEIQGYDRNREKNHIFFEMVEKDPVSHEVLAKISLVIFAKRKSFIEDVLTNNGNPFALKDDIEVKFLCKVDFYAPHGALRLSVENIDPVHTLGKIAQQKQKLIAMLKDKGTFDQNKKLELPAVPLNVGLITAYDSAAYNDFISELQKSKLAFKVFVRHTTMQGKKTEGDICRALKEFGKLPGLDLVVITRGGGSIADLSCFDSARIAETIAQYHLPVLSGIGHEINTTITDMAAHTYAKTPTAIAQFIVSHIMEFSNSLDEKLKYLLELSTGKFVLERQRLKLAALNLQKGTLAYLRDHNEMIIRFKEVIRKRPKILMKDSRRSMNDLIDQLKRNARLRLEKDKGSLKNYQKMITIVHPDNTLKRGFSIARQNGKVIKKINDVDPDKSLMTQLVDGTVESQVKSNVKRTPREENFDLFVKKD